MTDTAMGFTSSRHDTVIAENRNRLTTVGAYLVMVVSPGKKKGLEEISEKARIAAAAVSDLISSMTLAVEEKVALEHQIHNLARESEYMINGIDNISEQSEKSSPSL